MVKKVSIGFSILILLLVIGAFLSFQINKNYPPPKLTANFMDINKIRQISKYRSCAGHTVVPQDGREMKRNMKHYIEVYPELRKENTVEIYSPYDGFISVIRADMKDLLEGEIWIAPDRGILTILPPFNLWMFSFEHVQPRKDLKVGDKVKAGELIGYASFLVAERTIPTFDVIYGTMGLPMRKLDNWNSPFENLDSIFNHMSDEVLTQYEKKGITPEKIILSKETRDSRPCAYNDQGPYFENSDNSDNWVELQS